jgi:hypothetical protein
MLPRTTNRSGSADRDSALSVYLLALPYLHIVLEFICPNTFHTCYHQVDCYAQCSLHAILLALPYVKMTAFNAHSFDFYQDRTAT